MSNETPPLFIVGTGRCGSTMLSRLLAQHPDVASLSELYNSLGTGAFPRDADAVDGPTLWEALSRPRPHHQRWLQLLTHGIAIDEFRYPHTGLGRFREGGIPPLLTMTLPELSDDPDGLHEELRLFVEALPADRLGAQYGRVFQWLTERVGRRLWVERSGSSIAILPALIQHFPDARFVHIYRDGREAALSASRFPPMRLMAISHVVKTRVGKTLFEPVPPADVGRLPPDIRPLVASNFDVDAFLRVEIPLKYFGSVWSTQMVHGVKVLAGLPKERVLHLRYESILADPEPALRRLLSFLDPGLPQEAWLERALPLVRANPPKWPSLPPDERAALEDACARGMTVIENMEPRPRVVEPLGEDEIYRGGHDPESIRAELKRILVRVLELDIPPEQIRHTDPFFLHGFGIDTVEALALVREVERRFGVVLFEEKIDVRAFEDVLSLGQLVAGAMAREPNRGAQREAFHGGAASGPAPRAPSEAFHGGAASGPTPRAPSEPCSTRTMQRFDFTFPLPKHEPQIVRRWQADGSLVPSKLTLVNRPYSDQLGKSAPLLDEGHYLVGICAFENWPGRIHSPNDWPASREFDLFIEPSYRRYIGFMHNFRDPRDVFPGDFPLLDMDFSDYVQVRKRGRVKTFDMVYYAGHSVAGKPETTKWSSTIKGHELALTVIRTLLEVHPHFRVAIVNDVFGIDHPRVRSLGMLPYRAFLDLVESAHVLLVPSTLDASPRVITEALCLDTYVMVNADISGGWKYVDEETGAFFDRTDFLDVYARLRARGAAATRRWFLENYPNHTLEARFNAWINDCILRYCAFNRFGGVLYMCLDGDRREEREEMIRNELFRHMGIFGDCVEQVPAALVPQNPHKARALSHLAALRRARELGLPDVVIFEDDFQFIVPRQVANRKIEELLRSYPDRDAILFGNHQITRHEGTPGGAVLRVRAGAWPHGYAVRAERYDELISGLAEACAAMPDDDAVGTPLIDDVWTRFAGDANVHAFRVPLGEGMERMGRFKPLAVSTGASGVEGSCPQKPRPVSPVKLVTVVMPVYNGERHVAEATESILNQSLGDFELVVVDDGSTDRTVEILSSFRDPRIRLLRNPKNLGITASLNRGLDAASGVYVARMDADDVSLPERLAKQVAFMDDRADVGLSGAVEYILGSSERPRARSMNHDQMACILLFAPAFAHPTAMFRGDFLRRSDLRYDPEYECAEDYELWVRCAEQTRLGWLTEPVLLYRVHPGSIGRARTDEQRRAASRVHRRLLAGLGIEPSDDEQALHLSLARREHRAEEGYLDAVERWLERLLAANREHRRYAEDAFGRDMARRWQRAGDFAVAAGLATQARVLASPLLKGADLSPLQQGLHTQRTRTTEQGH